MNAMKQDGTAAKICPAVVWQRHHQEGTPQGFPRRVVESAATPLQPEGLALSAFSLPAPDHSGASQDLYGICNFFCWAPCGVGAGHAQAVCASRWRCPIPLGSGAGAGAHLAPAARCAALRGAYIWLMRGTPLMLQLLFHLLRPAVCAGDWRAPARSSVRPWWRLRSNYAAYFAEIFPRRHPVD